MGSFSNLFGPTLGDLQAQAEADELKRLIAISQNPRTFGQAQSGAALGGAIGSLLGGGTGFAMNAPGGATGSVMQTLRAQGLRPGMPEFTELGTQLFLNAGDDRTAFLFQEAALEAENEERDRLRLERGEQRQLRTEKRAERTEITKFRDTTTKLSEGFDATTKATEQGLNALRETDNALAQAAAIRGFARAVNGAGVLTDRDVDSVIVQSAGQRLGSIWRFITGENGSVKLGATEVQALRNAMVNVWKSARGQQEALIRDRMDFGRDLFPTVATATLIPERFLGEALREDRFDRFVGPVPEDPTTIQAIQNIPRAFGRSAVEEPTITPTIPNRFTNPSVTDRVLEFLEDEGVRDQLGLP